MLHDLIPNFDKEIAALNDMAPSGFIMGFNLTYKGPEHLYNAYPEAWRDIYQERNYFFSDPIARWTIEQEGWVRWCRSLVARRLPSPQFPSNVCPLAAMMPKSADLRTLQALEPTYRQLRRLC